MRVSTTSHMPDVIKIFISTSKLPGSSLQPCEVGGAGKFQRSPFTNEDAEAQRGGTSCPRSYSHQYGGHRVSSPLALPQAVPIFSPLLL